MTSPEPTGPRPVVDESHSLTPTKSSLAMDSAMRASRKTSLANDLADDERPWADHLSPAGREQLTAYLADYPEKAPAHLADHLAHVGILARPGATSSTAGVQPDPSQKEQP